MVNLDFKFWKNKKVLITGNNGFKGTWLSIFLFHLGAKVYGFSQKPKKNYFSNFINFNSYIKNQEYGDINNFSKFHKFIKYIRPEIVIHMAAQPLVIEAFKDPIRTFYTNINGTINVINSISKLDSINLFLNITTDKVYKTGNNLKLHCEDDYLQGSEFYSCSKVASDSITYILSKFSKNFNTKKYLIARSGNVIGGGDYSENRIVPDLLKAYNKNQTLIIRNDSHVRPWQHVLEPLGGYLQLIQNFYNKSSLSEKEIAWNFGPNKSSYKSVGQLVNSFKKKIVLKSEIQSISNKKNIESKFVGLDSSKAKKKLNWYPKWSLDQTIDKIIEWNSYSNSQKKIQQITVKQIEQYIDI